MDWVSPVPRSHVMHPWAVVVLCYWVLIGGALLLAPVTPSWTPILVLAGAESPVTMCMGMVLMVGSVMVLAAGRSRRASSRYTWEQIGLWLCAWMWAGFSLVGGMAFPSALSGWLQGITFLAACLLRIREVRRSESMTRANVDAMERDHA